MITPDDLKDEDNLAQCECGNFSHLEYVTSNDDGQNSCPACQIAWLNDILNKYKKLLFELADPQLKNSDINTRIKKELCDIMGIGIDDFPEEMEDCYLKED